MNYVDTSAFTTLDIPPAPIHPKSDELRKAAEWVILEWDNNRDIYAAIQILRAALRGYGEPTS